MWRVTGSRVRVLPGEQLVEHHSQRVNVAGGCDGLTFHLLGTGVSRGERAKDGQSCRAGFRICVDNFGNTEIQEFRRSLMGDENVAGFYIAMDDQPLMRILHGRADRREEFETFGNWQVARIAIFGDGLAFDQLHYKVRDALFSRAAVEQARDVGVIQSGENLSLILEAADDEIGVLAGAHQLDRNLFAVLIVGANGTINFAHTASADLFHDFVGPETPTDHRVTMVRIEIIRRTRIWRLRMGDVQKIRASLLMRSDE